MLSYVVHRLDKENELREEIQKLAQRHSGYGAKPEHYKLIGDTLIWSLKNNLGAGWNPQTETAWKNAYALVSGLMIDSQNA